MSKSLILVHGLFMKPLVMKFLEWHFKKLGYTTYQFSHPSRKFSEATLQRLSTLIDSLTTDECYVVGHSMGGLIAKQVLQEHAPRWKHRFKKMGLVTLGTPHQTSRLAGFLEKTLLRPMLGSSGDSGLTKVVPEGLPAGIPLGCIGGTLPVGLLACVKRIPNDGTVFLFESFDRKADASLAMKLSHTSLVYSKKVVQQTHHFFEHQSFKLG